MEIPITRAQAPADPTRLTAAGLVAVAGRSFESLAGPWALTLDLFGEGFSQNWPQLDERDSRAWDKPRDYDIAGGQTVEVPSCWNMNRPEWRLFEGTGWYTRSFGWAPRQPRERTVLFVGAAAYEAHVYLNGVFLGRHLGGSTPFCVELTSALRPGANRLQIAVDNRRRPERIPPERFDWFNYGGLYRDIGLLRLPPVFIADAALYLAPDGDRFTLVAEITLSDPADGVATVSVPELDLDLEVPISGGFGTEVVAVTPVLWSPARPKLYRVEARFRDDLIADRIGFRDIRVVGRELYLNGSALFLRGISVHEDDLVRGKSCDEADIRRRFAHARALNCNFLRLAHYPHDPRVAALADELGFLLWSEIPVYWQIDFANPETYRDAENQLAELIRRDRNRASVVLWSVGNETPDTPERTRFLADLARFARRTDPTRLVTAACTLRDGRIDDSLQHSLDVIGFNEYFGWYERDLEGLARALEGSDPKRPVLISELGADALAGLHDPALSLASEELQAAIYRAQFQMLSRAPYVCGTSPWLLYDFRSERRQSSIQRGFNRKGLIAEDKQTRKLAFAELARIYGRLAAERG
jgi:beta-glucuronidase